MPHAHSVARAAGGIYNTKMRAVAALLLLSAAILMGQDSPPPADWRDWIKQGTESLS